MAVSDITNMLRISGMSSGLDTESIVTSLMAVEKLKVNRVYQQKQMLEWRKEAHREINSLVKSFREATMSVLSPETNLFSEAAFRTGSVTMATSTNAVGITAGASALLGSYTIDRIDSLATAATAKGTQDLTGGAGLDRGATLESLAAGLGLTFGGENADTLSFEINDVSFSFKKTDTFDSVLSTVNSSDAGVSMVYSELTDQILLQTRETGASTGIVIANTEGNLFGSASAIGIAASSYNNGTDASLSINGVSVHRPSNTFTIDGATYTIKTTSASAVAFSVTRDVEPAAARIKSYVALYNELVGKLQDKLGEEVFSEYAPLTDEQKEDMSEAEITKWESKAKSGLLHNDRDLAGLLSKMRGMLYETVRGIGKSVSDIGIKTGAYYDGGKITLDETALKAALNKDPDAVMKLFTQTTTTSESETGSIKGLLPRLMETFTTYTSSFNVIEADEDIAKLGDRIGELNDMLADREEQYWSKFAAMEQALTTMQSQSSWLTQQFQS
ncbi:MAG: flagellar filament capping protein FliD [Clostridia bacterium]|nr:flagellar filament capping protein FliD [Clostridia bacterium]